LNPPADCDILILWKVAVGAGKSAAKENLLDEEQEGGYHRDDVDLNEVIVQESVFYESVGRAVSPCARETSKDFRDIVSRGRVPLEKNTREPAD